MIEVNEEGGSRRLVGWFNFEKSGKLIWFSKTPISLLSASALSSLSFLVGTYNSFLFEAPRSEEGDKRYDNYDNYYGAGHLIVSDGLLQGVHHLVEVALQALRHARHHPLHLGRYVVVIFVTWPVTKILFFSGTHIHSRHNFCPYLSVTHIHVCELLLYIFSCHLSKVVDSLLVHVVHHRRDQRFETSPREELSHQSLQATAAYELSERDLLKICQTMKERTRVPRTKHKATEKGWSDMCFMNIYCTVSTCMIRFSTPPLLIHCWIAWELNQDNNNKHSTKHRRQVQNVLNPFVTLQQRWPPVRPRR